MTYNLASQSEKNKIVSLKDTISNVSLLLSNNLSQQIYD